MLTSVEPGSSCVIEGVARVHRADHSAADALHERRDPAGCAPMAHFAAIPRAPWMKKGAAIPAPPLGGRAAAAETLPGDDPGRSPVASSPARPDRRPSYWRIWIRSPGLITVEERLFHVISSRVETE